MVSGHRSATFANCYPAGYLDALHLRRTSGPDEALTLPSHSRRRLRPSATTLAMAAGDIALRTFENARRGEGLTHDIDGARARAMGFEVPSRSPDEAAEIFWGLSRDKDFAMFEHFMADEAGHARDWEKARQALDAFDRFCRAAVAQRPRGWHLLVCSDHGNVEDLSSRSHTLNRVPLLHFGPAPAWDRPPRNLAELGRAMLRLVGIEP